MRLFSWVLRSDSHAGVVRLSPVTSPLQPTWWCCLCVAVLMAGGCGPSSVDVNDDPDGGPPSVAVGDGGHLVDDMDGGADGVDGGVDGGPSTDDHEECDCTPPADACASGDAVLRYVVDGCDDGQCRITTEEVVCNAPPSPTCADDGTRLSFDDVGSCDMGECVYAARNERCDTPPPAVCVDDDRLQVFDLDGSCGEGECSYASTTTTCTLGCCDDHCCAAHPAEDDWGLPSDNGRIVGPPSGAFHTADDCHADASLGDCDVVQGDDGIEACVCRAREMHIADLHATGPHALVLWASSTIVVTGALSVAGDGGTDGPGASYRYADGLVGGAGGSFGSEGAASSAGGVAGVYGNDTLTPLLGGMRGEPGCGASAGGGGGGALVLVAGDAIEVTGALNAGGGGGGGGASNARCGGGGGSGGSIRLEAPSVVMTGVAAANGGGGGSGGTETYRGRDGNNGTASTDPAGGGSAQSESTCPLGGTIYSGRGGAGAVQDQLPTTGAGGDVVTSCFETERSGRGGAGGGLGRIRVNTTQGCQCNGVFSPLPTFGALRVQ